MERRAIRNGSDTNTIVQVGSTRFGHDLFPVIAGPRAIESEDQIMRVARSVSEAGAAVLRGGVFESSTSPYDFPGLGKPALRLLQQAGREVELPTMTKALEPKDVDLVAEHVDMIYVDPGSMQNFELLRVIGSSGKPVLLERGGSATIDEWLWAAEYILAEGNDQVVLCEAGIRTFETSTRATLDLSSIPVLKEKSHLPVIVAPSAAAGSPARIQPLALAAQGVGADGLMIEVHPDPRTSRTSVSHHITLASFEQLMEALGVNRIRMKIDMIDRDLVRLLARRHGMAMEIGRIKAQRGMPVQVPDREEELLSVIREEAGLCGLDPDEVERIFLLVLEQSRNSQEQERTRSWVRTD